MKSGRQSTEEDSFMLSNTHTLIADKVFTQLKYNNGIIIDRRLFKYGSIKPDYTPRLINIGHYEKESLGFVQNEIRHLSSLPYSKDKNFLRHYSIGLGVVIHYLSDYFCHAHNNILLKSDMIQHFIYEARLGHAVGKFEKNMNMMEDSLITALCIGGINDYLNIKLDSYKQAKVSYFNDITYALEASYAVCLFIINASMSNAKPAAA